MIRLRHGQYFGSPRGTHAVAGVTVRENSYAPNAWLPMHVHAHPYICFVMAGGFSERSGRNLADCGAGSVIWHPEGEPHEDRFGGGGGTCVGLDFDASWLDRFREAETLPARWTFARGGAASWLAARITLEAAQPDTLTPFALDGLTCALVATLARSDGGVRARRPRWLDRGLDRLREEFRQPPSVAALAADAGVHRGHFIRVFHRHVGCTVAEYVRRLRIDWACRELERSEHPSLSELSLLAGFADQAHFSRTFKRITGTTPRQYRREVERRA